MLLEQERSVLIPGNQANDLWWHANHILEPQPARGGWETVRMLLGTIDGDYWPWTCITRDATEAYRWGQVLGAADRMTLELGNNEATQRVGHAHRARGHPIELPPECQWWVTWVWSHQVFTADEALPILRDYLLTDAVDTRYLNLGTLTESRHRRP